MSDPGDGEQAARMFAQGKTYREIAAELGMESPRHVHEAILSSLAGVATQNTDELRQRWQADLREHEARLWKIATNPPPLIRDGEVVTDPQTGEPVPDSDVMVAAATALLRIHERRAKFLGLTAPVQRVRDMPPGELERRLEELRAEFEAGEPSADEKPPPIPEDGGE